MVFDLCDRMAYYMVKTFVACFMCASALNTGVSGYSPSKYFLDEHCDRKILVSKDMVLKLTHFTSRSLKRNWKCSVLIQTPASENNLLIQFRYLDTDLSIDCQQIGVKIFDTNGTIKTDSFGVCGSKTPRKQYETNGKSTKIQVQTNDVVQTGDFSMLITSFRHATQNGTCFNTTQFRCDNNRCISDSITCNGYNDCGDESDEIRGCGFSASVIAGLVVAGILVASVIISFIIVFRRRYCSRYRRI